MKPFLNFPFFVGTAIWRSNKNAQSTFLALDVNADQAMVAETITNAPVLQASSQAVLDQVIQQEMVEGVVGQKPK